ncbi:HutD family protein [Streptomyces sp. NPDC086519]|uniref:HutD/Ves family protein n=1 Tax=Streptomyces sp. NPDC086519 TaxID=3154863 RepID=UPI0034137206
MTGTLAPSRVAPTPWRNGAGTTRELATGTDASGRVLWRLSVADLDRDAPFSTFPGLDRLFVALGPLRLTVDGRQRRLAVGDQARFAGEAPVAVALDTPTRALNVMTRRGACRAEVILRPVGGPRLPADATVLLDELAADVRLFKEPDD